MIFEGAVLLGVGANLLSSSKTRLTLIEKCSDALGGAFKPWQVRRVAQAQADARVIDAQATQQIENLAERAVDRQLGQSMREQKNIETIISMALPNVENDAKPEQIEEDWLANFFDKNRIISNDEMQKLWAQILAGEANSPGTFSRRTVNFLATLEPDEAASFRKTGSLVCKLSTSSSPTLIIDIKALDSLPIELSLDELYHLSNIGLLSIEIKESTDDSGFECEGPNAEMHYHDETILIKNFDETDSGIQVGDVDFTKVGAELFSVCQPDICDGAIQYFTEYFALKGYEVTKL